MIQPQITLDSNGNKIKYASPEEVMIRLELAGKTNKVNFFEWANRCFGVNLTEDELQQALANEDTHVYDWRS